MNNKILSEIYKDFFSASNTQIENIEPKDETKLEEDTIRVESLYLENDSKELLKKILNFMESFSKSEEKNYIHFAITLETDNELLLDNITKILKKANQDYNYTDKNTLSLLSLYSLEKVDELDKCYMENGIIVIKDLSALKLFDDSFKQKLFHLLKEKLKEQKITIITGKKEDLSEFFKNDIELKTNYFLFSLVEEKPDINDVYLMTLEKLNESIITEPLKISILDYITSTYTNSTTDVTTYLNHLVNYISFHKEVPKLKQEKSVDEIFKELNDLVGLEKVKKVFSELVDYITLRRKTEKDLTLGDINLHMVFLGNPGTGKTTVARLVCNILYELNYIKENKLIEVSTKDLVGEYVGQTAPKTMKVIESAINGVLFIDEAYTLGNNGTNSYNAEAIATLIKAMEDHRDELVVIFAGYTKEMESFLNSNSGIVSRIGYTLTFDDYTNDELKQIFINMMKKSGFIVKDEVFDELDALINKNRENKNFGNARFIRNVYEKTVLKHASNTKNKVRKDLLKTITKDDICV